MQWAFRVVGRMSRYGISLCSINLDVLKAMARYRRYIYIIGIAVLAIMGCTGDNNDSKKYARQPKDTVHTAEKRDGCFRIRPCAGAGDCGLSGHRGKPARLVGRLLQGANLQQYAGTGTARFDLHGVKGAAGDTARVIAERLLCHDSIKVSLARQQDVLEVLAYTARQQNDTLGWLQRSRELVEVCHGQGAETEALRNEAEVGAALCFLGKETEGMARIDSVIALLDVKKFNELDAMLIVLKRKVMVLAERGHYAEMLPPACQMLERLSDYEQHSDRYHDSSYREPKDSTDRQDYIEFYRSKAQKYIAAAYAAISESGSMEEFFRQLEAIVRDAAAREHRARYQAIEQQCETERQRAEARRNALIAWSTGIISLLAICLALFALYKHRETRRKNRALVRQIDEAMAYKERYEALLSPQILDTPKGGNAEDTTDTDLFAQIHDTIVREQLYLNPTCDRQMLIDRFGLSKERIGAAFVKGSSHPSLSAYINDLRLEHAYKLLLDQPGLDLGQVAQQSGFSSRKYFGDRFKSRYGMTPSEFRAARQ